MKKKSLALFGFFSLIVLNCMAQAPITPPTAAHKIIKKEYAPKSSISWKQSPDGYIADFKSRTGQPVSILFDNNGNKIETFTPITETEIPVKIKKTLNKQYKGLPVVHQEIIETAKGETFYRLVIKKEQELIKLRMNTAGSILKTERENK